VPITLSRNLGLNLLVPRDRTPGVAFPQRVEIRRAATRSLLFRKDHIPPKTGTARQVSRRRTLPGRAARSRSPDLARSTETVYLAPPFRPQSIAPAYSHCKSMPPDPKRPLRETRERQKGQTSPVSNGKVAWTFELPQLYTGLY
jgi:hypothetical protein